QACCTSRFILMYQLVYSSDKSAKKWRFACVSGLDIMQVPQCCGGSIMADKLEQTTMRAVTGRVIPILLLGYLIAYVDRINVGFAATALRTDFHISNTVFGF